MLATLKLPLPPSVNTYWRNFRGRTVLSKAGRDYKLAIQDYVVQNQIPKFGDKRLSALITIFPRDKRTIDLDNRLKGLFDALESAGVYDSDSQFDFIQVARSKIKPGGECGIVISVLNE